MIAISFASPEFVVTSNYHFNTLLSKKQTFLNVLRVGMKVSDVLQINEYLHQQLISNSNCWMT